VVGRLVSALALVGLVLALAPPSGARHSVRPLAFAWPTGVEVERGGTLLVVENGTGKIKRIAPVTRKVSVVGTIDKAYRTASVPGAIFISATASIWRIAAGTRNKVVDGNAGPIAATTTGDVYFTSSDGLFELPHGDGPPLSIPGTASFGGSHGIATAGDYLLVSDTDHNRVLRVDLNTRDITTFATVGSPRGILAAPNGSVYVVESSTKRILHLGADGTRKGFVGPRFIDPYDIARAKDGTIYVVDTSAFGTVKRIAPSGKTSTL
jgi:sugar lactone lactonase YvrE